jgi:ABC-2 type transport system permease protein
MGVLAAERIKLVSTRSPWWCSGIIVVLGLGLAWLFGWIAKQSAESPEAAEAGFTTDNAMAMSGVTGFGVMVLMILAALTVTSEHRFGVIRNSFLATPHRARVLLAKAGVVSALAVVLTTVLSLAAIYIAKAAAGSYGDTIGFLDAESWRQFYAVPVYAVLCVFLAIGVGAIVKQSAGAIALLLLWPLLVEPLLANAFGAFSRNVGPFLPFENANQFLGVQTGTDFHWGPWGSLAYFAAFVAVVFVGSLVIVNNRDA